MEKLNLRNLKLNDFDFFDVFIFVISIIIISLSIYIYKWYGLLLIPVIALFIYIYYNSSNIVKWLKKEDKLEKIKKINFLKKGDDLIMAKKKKPNNKTNNENNNKKDKSKEKNKKVKKVKEKKVKRKLWKRIVTVILVMGIVAVIAVAGLFAYIALTTDKFDPNALKNQDQTIVYDVNNEVIAKLGTEKRESVSYDQLPQVLIDAIVATEDSRFFQHNGVDLPRFIKATVYQLLGQSGAGGASTLTMQISKNHLTSTKKSIMRKLEDVYISVFQIEKKYTKEEILEFYVNDSYLGGSAWGVQEASRNYFGKDVSEISLPEAALLAGLFQAPDGHDPYKNPKSANKRISTVLNLMYRHGYITKEERDIAKQVDIETLLVGKPSNGSEYQGYIDTVVEEIMNKTKTKEKPNGDNPYTVPMIIYTTMEKGIQDGINKAMTGETYTWHDDYAQSGIAVINVETGAIAAVGAGRNKNGILTHNFATQETRQPGSTAKPLFAYGPAIEFNNASTYTLYMDEPWQYSNGVAVGNWDSGYQGLITMRQALAVSRNIPALKAFQNTNKKSILNFVTSLGITPEIEGGSIHEAHAIGGFNPGATPLQMASAYAAFASMGYYTEPYSVTKIEYRNTGEVVEYKANKEKVMKDSTAYLMNNMLEYATNNGFSGGGKVYGSHVATKTGTTNYDEATRKRYGLPDYATNDLWTISYTSKYSVALWYGYAKIMSDYYNTNNAPKDTLMANIMQYIPKDTVGWTMPSSVVASRVEKETWPAQLPSEYTPEDMILTEYFVKGTEPANDDVSPRYAALPNITNVKETTKTNKDITITWSFKEPEVNTTTYLKTYFSNSVYGKQGEKSLNTRLEYNKNTLGDIGFTIYAEDSTGALTKLDFTKNNYYTYTPKNNYTALIIKTEYEKFKSNASDGYRIKLSSSGNNNDNKEITIELTGNKQMVVQEKNYKENGITVKYNNKDVTSSATITYAVNGTSYSSVKDLENAVNALPAGDYKITYTATYNGQTPKTAERTLTITKKN